jgi:SAM-dependent methyltransferase
MPALCSVGLDTSRLAGEVRAMYTRVADNPGGDYHFHRGPDYAVSVLGYGRASLDSLPYGVTSRFAGVGNPLAIAPVLPGARVVDVGGGGGTDLLLAARQVGPSGRVIGVDMTGEMLELVRAGADRLYLTNVVAIEGDATSLPVESEWADVVISNGVLNLVPDKDRALAEMWRVLVPGGRMQFADILLREGLSEDERSDIDLWTG